MSAPRPAPPRHRAALLLTVAGVTALHAWLLPRLHPAREERLPDPRPGPALRWRVLELPPLRPAAVAQAEVLKPPPAAPQAAPARRPPPRPVPMLVTPVEAPALRLALTDAAALEAEAASAVTASGVDTQAPGAQATPPVYATVLPPPLLRRYRLARGALSGTAELRWAPGDDGRYLATLGGELAGERVLDWRSTGALDGAGIAPERYVTRGRRGRGAQAANFQREAGKLSYAGPALEFALPAGAQDRLSVLLQVAAIVAAEPGRFRAGAALLVFVTGARGDADVWRFDVEGEEAVADAQGAAVRALKLTRQAQRRYDAPVELWLDPQRHFLPLRVRLSAPNGGEALEMVLESEEKLP